ncbi:MAG: hypothetical protein L3J73_01495, partial [Thermoplasmata archaeon]|nr:hypothetical protein [Thermoplasmata archaeon]
DFKAILVPMFFVPLGHLKSRDWFSRDRVSAAQEELFKRALTHGLRQSKRLLRDFFEWEGGHTTAYRSAFRGFIGFLELAIRMNGLWSEPTTQTPTIESPLRHPERIPIPSIPLRE